MQLDPILLPDLTTLRRRAKALAMIDAIICPEWEYRYFSYDAHWHAEEEVASMRNGSGDDWFLLFGPFGAAIKGLAHESTLAGDEAFARQVQTQVPVVFLGFLNEPAFGVGWLSYCYWRRNEDSVWHKVVALDPKFADVNDGSKEFLALLHESADAYVTFAKHYYEVELPLAAVESIYRHESLTDALVGAVNPDLTVADVKASATTIGYPT